MGKQTQNAKMLTLVLCLSKMKSTVLTHWGRVTHIWVGKLTSIGSNNGSSPGQRQAIIWTNAGILLIEPVGTNFSELFIEIKAFSLTKLHLKMSFAKVAAILSWPQCVNGNVLYWDVVHVSSEAGWYAGVHTPGWEEYTATAYTHPWLTQVRDNRACHPGGHYWNYYPGALSCNSSRRNSFEDRAPVD